MGPDRETQRGEFEILISDSQKREICEKLIIPSACSGLRAWVFVFACCVRKPERKELVNTE